MPIAHARRSTLRADYRPEQSLYRLLARRSDFQQRLVCDKQRVRRSSEAKRLGAGCSLVRVRQCVIGVAVVAIALDVDRTFDRWLPGGREVGGRRQGGSVRDRGCGRGDCARRRSYLRSLDSRAVEVGGRPPALQRREPCLPLCSCSMLPASRKRARKAGLTRLS